MIKKKIAQKMIQHTHYDRKLGKLVRTMVPADKKAEKERTKNWPKGHYHEPSEQEKRDYQHKIGRAYSE